MLGSIQPQVVPNRPDGTMELAEVEAVIKPLIRTSRAPGSSRSKIPSPATFYPASIWRTRSAWPAQNLAIHLDGARVFNAATALGMKVSDLCAGFDSMLSCLSKGLGAPAGTCFWEARLSSTKRSARKILGGGMRQAGVIAARRSLCAREQRRASRR